MDPTYIFIIHWSSVPVLFLASIFLLKKQMDISLGFLIMLFLASCLPFFNIVIFGAAGGFDKLIKYFKKIVIKQEE